MRKRGIGRKMARNYSREARLSKIYAKSVINKAYFVTLLYHVAIFCVELLSLLFIFDFLGISLNEIIGGLALPLDIELIIGLAVLVLGLVYMLLNVIPPFKYALPLWRNVFGKKPEHFTEMIGEIKEDDQEEITKARIKDVKEQISYTSGKEKKRLKRKLKQLKKKLKYLKNRIPAANEFFKHNRYEKNKFTEIQYKRIRKILTRTEKTFVLSGLLAVIEFLVVLFMNAYHAQPDTDIWTLINPAHAENSEFYYMFISFIYVIVFHCICATIAGSIGRIRLVENETTYMHVWRELKPEALMHHSPEYSERVTDVKSVDTVPPGESYEFFYPRYTGPMSVPRKTDMSDAILEEIPREYSIGIFFLRNFVQTIFAFSAVMVFVSLVPSFKQVWESESSMKMIFMILQALTCVALIYFVAHALSTREYEYDCMDENLEGWGWRKSYRLILFATIAVAAVSLVFLFIGDFKGLLSEQVFESMQISFILFIVFCITAFVLDFVMLPIERKTKEGDFFAFSDLNPTVAPSYNGDDVWKSEE